jgi:hypothetical protein
MENDRQYLRVSELVVGNTYKLIDTHNVIFKGIEGTMVYFEPEECDSRSFHFSKTHYHGVDCWGFNSSSLDAAGKLYLIEDNNEKTVEEMVAAIHAMIVKIIR